MCIRDRTCTHKQCTTTTTTTTTTTMRALSVHRGGGGGGGGHYACTMRCLLYTSPSPRDSTSS
eukprot:5193112-Prorocentrum_lima.AAC.1